VLKIFFIKEENRLLASVSATLQRVSFLMFLFGNLHFAKKVSHKKMVQFTGQKAPRCILFTPS